jgi:hypothetical protein
MLEHFFEWRLLARLSRPYWRWFTAIYSRSELLILGHVQTFTPNDATIEPDA